MRRLKQVIVVRKDLKMRRGKETAQVSHGSMAFMLRKVNNGTIHLSKNALEWLETGQTKVCVGCDSERELLDIYQQALSAGLTAHLITDAGRTEFNEPTKTVVAIGPDLADKIDKITGHLTLR